MNLDFDAEFEAALTPSESRKRAEITAEQFAALPWKNIPCGYCTLTLTDGSLKRFRIRLERGKFCPGHRTLSVHRAPAIAEPPHEERIEHEWETLALIGTGGLNIFKRWRNEWEGRWCEVIWKLLNGQDAQGYAINFEARCWATMRALTDEDGRRTGLCKTWRKRFNL